MSNIKLNTNDVILYFNAIRNLPDNERSRGLDAFWDGQINSKVWLVETLNKHHKTPSNVYIFGGWIGVLANILFQANTFHINKIYNIDIDPWCKSIAESINPINDRINRFVTDTVDMAYYKYPIKPDIVINTSTEHVSQETYNTWFNNIPKGTLVVLQGNDYFECDEHIRCSKNLDDFIEMNHVYAPVFKGELKTSMYTRFMCIFVKS